MIKKNVSGFITTALKVMLSGCVYLLAVSSITEKSKEWIFITFVGGCGLWPTEKNYYIMVLIQIQIGI